MLGISALTVMQPWPLKIVFDYILIPGRTTSRTEFLSPLTEWSPSGILAVAAGTVLVLAILKGLLTYSHSVLSKVVGHRLVAAIRMRLFSHVQRLPLSYHDYRETGELMTRMTGDISLLQDLLVSSIISFGSQILLVVGMLGIMLWLDWQLALIAVGVMPFFLIAAFRYSGRIRHSARHQREMYGKIVASVQESLAGISQVKSYAQEKKRERMIGRSMDRDVSANVKTTKLTANYARIIELISAVGTCLVLWLGTQKAITGQISPGDLLIFLSYLRGVYRPVKNLARLSSRIAKSTVRGEKLIELLEIQPEVHEPEGAVSAKGIIGDIKLNNLDFSYLPTKKILHNFSCTIPYGKTTLITGPTGAGKSTIAKLILRLYEQQSGTITIGDRNITDFRIRSLRKQITPLSQESFLFRMTVAENIAFGMRKASPEDIEKAAKLVGADEFIRSLPDGYDTLVGESGLTLSGGQRQRVCFARAALRKSPVMIFDEPATGLDVYAEEDLKEVLRSLQTERTMIIITHRLHFLQLSDWVVHIRDGKLAEEGEPKELLDAKGSFYQMVRASQTTIEADSYDGKTTPTAISGE